MSLRKLTHLWLAKNAFLRRPAAGTKLLSYLTARCAQILKPHFWHRTGTIGLMMDCDTTGIEPDLGLVKG